MNTSVGMKVKKKQPPLSVETEQSSEPVINRQLEQCLLSLENACLRVFDSELLADINDNEAMFWQQKFKNIVTPVSLALAECKGPRRFHFHYKHRTDDDSVLSPVMENPLAQLTHVCENALKHCHQDLVGIQDREIVRNRDMFQAALANFIQLYEQEA